MSRLSYEIGEAIAALPKTKDNDGNNGGKTCRSLIYDGISDAAWASIQGGPWAVEVEVALHNLRLAVDNAIDADPVLKEIFDRSRPNVEWLAREVLRKYGHTQEQAIPF
jgi:hypothetical protein